MEYSIEAANAYVSQHKGEVNARYRTWFHAMPPLGWINDPNGFCFFRGQYHLFCQFHPYDATWGPMHWGHWVTDDLLHWTWVGVAMAPDQPYDELGCFSGTALCTEDALVVMYTGVSRRKDGVIVQQQCIARSEDGLHFTKDAANPVIGSDALPAGAAPQDFRDPKLFRAAAGYRAVMASKGVDGGQLLCYRSPDLSSWELAGIFARGVGEMTECPDIHTIDGHDVMLSCVVGMPVETLRYPCTNPAVYFVGKLNADASAFSHEPPEAIDHGLALYAPQAVSCPDGRCVMVGWMPGWGVSIPTQKLGHGWAGCMSLPRELSVHDGMLLQRPLRELELLRCASSVHFSTTVLSDGPLYGHHGQHMELMLSLRPGDKGTVCLKLFSDGTHGLTYAYDAATHVLTVTQDGCGHDTQLPDRPVAAQALVHPQEGIVKLHLFLDVCTAELFVGEGEVVFTTMVFPFDQENGWSIEASKPCGISLEMWSLGGK